MCADQPDGPIVSRNQHARNDTRVRNNDEFDSLVYNDRTKSQTRCDDTNEPKQCLCCNIWGLPVLRHVSETDHDRAFDVLVAVVSLCLCLGEIGSEVKLLLEYYMSGEHLSFGLTLGFMLITTVVVGIFTLMWTLIDIKQQKGHTEDNLLSVCRIIASFLHFGRAFRLVEYIYNRYQGGKAKVELRDASILGLFEGYMETALKFQLQLYLMFATDVTTKTRALFLLISLASISFSVTSCYMTQRKFNRGRKSVTFSALVVYLLMRLCELGPRFMLLVLCFKFVGLWTMLVSVFCHFVLMFTLNVCYVKPENNQMCDQRCLLFFYLFLSYVEIYSFLNMNKGKSKHTSLIYYVIFYLENAVMMSLVLYMTYSGILPFMTWCMFSYSAIPGFVLHLFFLYLYYSCLHSTRNRPEQILT